MIQWLSMSKKESDGMTGGGQEGAGQGWANSFHNQVSLLPVWSNPPSHLIPFSQYFSAIQEGRGAEGKGWAKGSTQVELRTKQCLAADSRQNYPAGRWSTRRRWTRTGRMGRRWRSGRSSWCMPSPAATWSGSPTNQPTSLGNLTTTSHNTTLLLYHFCLAAGSGNVHKLRVRNIQLYVLGKWLKLLNKNMYFSLEN